MILGEASALMAAMSYSYSSNVYSFSVKQSTPILINLQRGLVSGTFMLITLLLLGDSIFPQNSLENYLILIFSGIFGIGIGDCFYFKAIDLLGARKTLLLQTMAPLFTGIISYLYFGTTLSLEQWTGILITASGIYIVVNEKTQVMEEAQILSPPSTSTDFELPLINVPLIISKQQLIENLPPQQSVLQKIIQRLQKGCERDFIGILNGIAFTFCQALGIVLSHQALRSGHFSALQSAIVRIIAGIICVALIVSFSKTEKFFWGWKSAKQNLLFISGVFVGSFIGIWSQQTSLLYTRPEIAQTILATTPLFGLLISYYRGEEMKFKYLLGSLVAVVGVAIIVWL